MSETIKKVIEISVQAKGIKKRCRKIENHFLKDKQDFDDSNDVNLQDFFDNNMETLKAFAKGVIDSQMKSTEVAYIRLAKVKVKTNENSIMVSREQSLFCKEKNLRVQFI